MIRGMTKNVNNLTDATFENMEYISVTGCYGDLHGKRLTGKFPGQENYGVCPVTLTPLTKERNLWLF